MKKIVILAFVLMSLFGCEKENITDNSDFIETFELVTNACKTSFEQSTICLDTILSDSRCATGTVCKWEGNATIELDLTTHDDGNYKVVLNTNPGYPIDTIIGNIYILLTDLTPYPEIGTVIYPNDYTAKLKIANIGKLKSNAKVIDFNADKCGCCWGWSIQIGNDTIKCDNEKIGKSIGYSIDYPVAVYVELGDLEQNCSEFGGYDYYKLNQIIKVE